MARPLAKQILSNLSPKKIRLATKRRDDNFPHETSLGLIPIPHGGHESSYHGGKIHDRNGLRNNSSSVIWLHGNFVGSTNRFLKCGTSLGRANTIIYVPITRIVLLALLLVLVGTGLGILLNTVSLAVRSTLGIPLVKLALTGPVDLVRGAGSRSGRRGGGGPWL